MDYIMNIIQSSVWTIILVFIGSYLAGYLTRKGEHLATKEDFSSFSKQLKETTIITESIKHELSLSKSTFDSYLHEILDVYANLYKYYRLCQRVVNSNIIRYPNGLEKYSVQVFNDKLDEIVLSYANGEAYVRLLLPDKAIEVIDRLVEQYNCFKKIVKSIDTSKKETYIESYNNNHQELINTFKNIHDLDKEIRDTLRKFLRTKNIIPKS